MRPAEGEKRIEGLEWVQKVCSYWFPVTGLSPIRSRPPCGLRSAAPWGASLLGDKPAPDVAVLLSEKSLKEPWC